MFALIDKHEMIRPLIVIATNRTWHLIYLDVKSAFLNGPSQEGFYVLQPLAFVIENKKGLCTSCIKLYKDFNKLQEL